MFTSTRASTKESKAELVGRRVKRFVVVFVGCRGSGKDYGRKTTKVPLCLGEQKKSLTHCGQIQKRQVEHYKRPVLYVKQMRDELNTPPKEPATT